MKKILLITTIALLVYINTFGQQQTKIRDIVTVTMPKKSEKLSKEKLVALKRNNGKVFPVIHDEFKGESFKGQNFLVQLNAAPIVPKPDFLEQQKKEMDDLYSFAQIYNTSIKRFHNYSAVVTNYEYVEDEKGYFIFKSYNKTGDIVLVGTLEYDKANKEAAEKDLEEMLKSIKFKNP